MNCTNCGGYVPSGANACPSCGTAVAYSSSGSSPYDPTVVSSQNPQSGPYDPTVAVSQGSSSPYGSTSYGTPPSGPYNQPQQNPYGAPPQSPYGAPNPYGAPPAPNPYEAPPQYPYGVPPQPYAPPPPKRRGGRIGLIIAIVVALLLIACVGVAVLAVQSQKNNTQGNSSTPTVAPTPTPSPQVTQATAPSGSSIVPSAAAIITNPKMASSIDKNYYPTNLTNTFGIHKDIYVTYKLNLNGQAGYATAKWYDDGKYAFTSKILTLNDPTFDHGYFAATYNIATTGTVELYWCTKSDCSDAQLADVVNFAVTSTSNSPMGQPAVAMLDMNNKEW